jgi:hypothetical protein
MIKSHIWPLKNYALVILTFLILNCKSKYLAPQGIYKSKKPGFASLLLTNSTYTSGETLVLFSDSTYVDTICGNILYGRYFVRNDSLFLIEKENRSRTDSSKVTVTDNSKLNKQGNSDIFIIDKNLLTQEMVLKDKKVLRLLKKLDSD